VVNVRDATEDDVEALAAIYRAAEGYVREALGAGEVSGDDVLVTWLGERMGARGASAVARWLIAVEQGECVGYVELAAPDELAAMYVVPPRWGTGVGRALHAAAVEHLRACGLPAAHLWVIEGNARARRFYEREGWRLVDGRRPLPFRDVELALVRYRIALT
jgi:GNAT superfamily N-acetyltransferase